MTSTRVTIAAAIFSILGLVRPVAAASAYDTFRIPRHHWSAWTIDLDGSGQWRHTNDPFEGVSDIDDRSGNIGSTAAWGIDSDDLTHALSVMAGAGGYRRHSEISQIDTLVLQEREETVRFSDERITLQGDVRLYPWSIPAGVEIAAVGHVSFNQSSQSGDVVLHGQALSRSRHRDEFDRYAQYVNASLAVGLGKVRDATGVYQAQLLEHRLLATGSLQRALSGDAREKLAALYYIEPRFFFPHDRPAKFFWQELERILREDGALDTGRLDAYGVLRVLEPAFDNRFITRRNGFFIGPTVFVEDSRSNGNSSFRNEFTSTVGDSVIIHTEFSTSQRHRDQQSRVGVGARAEYHRPIDMRWQADAASTLSYVEAVRRMSVSSGVGVTYLIADRWYADGRIDHWWTRIDHSRPYAQDFWSVNYGAGLAYYLADAWRIGISWSGEQHHQPNSYTRDGQVSLGITYQVAGSLEAPGLMEPQRLDPNAP